jgi:hypothetical protein
MGPLQKQYICMAILKIILFSVPEVQSQFSDPLFFHCF